MANHLVNSSTRAHILRSALRSFADCGYAGTSIQQIVDDAGVSKPALYYYFGDKAGLFRALVDQAHDGRYQLMQESAARGQTIVEKLEEIVAAVFEFSVRNKDLMRLAFATAFAAPGETPPRLKCRAKGKRNYEFLRGLIAQGQARGELDKGFDADELAMGIYGQLNMYVMIRLLSPEFTLGRSTARRVIRLFLAGAARKQSRSGLANGSSR